MSFSHQLGYNYTPVTASSVTSQLLTPGVATNAGSDTSGNSSISIGINNDSSHLRPLNCNSTPPPSAPLQLSSHNYFDSESSRDLNNCNSPPLQSLQPTPQQIPSQGLNQQSVYSPPPILNYPPRVPTGLSAADTMNSLYTSAYAAQGYVPFGSDPSAFYSPLSSGTNTDAWRNLSQSGAWPYDPTMAAYPYSTGYGGLDVRRKNATREATSTLKAWLYEHIKNPYPTKGEKIMLAIITKMTLTQVSTWFANARRRLKKENKMQWSPRNRTGDDDDDDKDESDGDDAGDRHGDDNGSAILLRKDATAENRDEDDEDIVVDGSSATERISSPGDRSEDGSALRDNSTGSLDISTLSNNSSHHQHHLSPGSNLLQAPTHHHQHLHTSHPYMMTPSSLMTSSDRLSALSGNVNLKEQSSNFSLDGLATKDDTTATNSSQNKPRIWSMADMATTSQPHQMESLQRRSPVAIAQSLINKSGYTAFSSPPSTQGAPPHHPVLNGSYAPLSTSSLSSSSTSPQGGAAAAATLNPYSRFGSYLPGSAMSGMLPNFHRPSNMNPLVAPPPPPLPSCAAQRIGNTMLGNSMEGPRLTPGGSTCVGLDDTSTAFKPVIRRS